MLGNSNDDARHIIGKLLGGSGGKKRCISSTPRYQWGLFREFEKDVATFVLKNGAVDVDIKFVHGKSLTRPDETVYEVSQMRKHVLFDIFPN